MGIVKKKKPENTQPPSLMIPTFRIPPLRKILLFGLVFYVREPTVYYYYIKDFRMETKSSFFDKPFGITSGVVGCFFPLPRLFSVLFDELLQIIT